MSETHLLVDLLPPRAPRQSIARALSAYTRAVIQCARWRVAWTLSLMVSLSLVEGAGLLMLVQLLQVVGVDTQQGEVGQLAGFVTQLLASVGFHPTLPAVLGIFIVVYGAQSLLYRWNSIANLALGQKFALQLQQQLYRALAGATWIFFSRSRSSVFVHVLTAEVERVEAAAEYLLQLVANVVVASAFIALALHLSGPTTLLAFACGAMLLLLLKPKTEQARRSGDELSSATSELYGATIEHMAAMKTTKSYGAESRNVDNYCLLSERVARIWGKVVSNHAGVRFWFDVGSVLILSLILVVLLQLLATPTAGILVLLFLFARILPRLSAIQRSYGRFLNNLPAFETIQEMQTRCEATAEVRQVPARVVGFEQSIRLNASRVKLRERIGIGYG